MKYVKLALVVLIAFSVTACVGNLRTSSLEKSNPSVCDNATAYNYIEISTGAIALPREASQSGIQLVSISHNHDMCQIALIQNQAVIRTGWFKPGDFLDLDKAQFGSKGLKLISIDDGKITIRHTN